MTYLSRIRINPLRAESRKLLANPRAMHAAVTGGIPGTPTGERTLWRLDADNPHRPHLFVLTPTKPDWTHLVENAGWPDADGDHAAIRDYTPLLNQLATGREFAFRLTASPVQNTHTPIKPSTEQTTRLESADTDPGKRPRGFRLSHRTAAHQLHWLLTRAEKWGFDIPTSFTDPAAPGLTPAPTTPHATPQNTPDPHHPDPNPAREVRIRARQRQSFTKNPSGRRVTFHTVTFEGHLRITDPTQLTTHLLNGIGPQKAYGCGLLTLAPLPTRTAHSHG
ncbi:type I-E CRISPR-associated protein Cas6/Cse3/CasE [Streptomyces bohaiensis]|uniref:Type I-E CRISPR-associated protein Cas6/Cse3/CasE n=3 Tax=Streptomyces bohaiensis TaxID=1431344 RepID=A0ABX1C2M7_9ACTN|nr:type I-E CRISPR-associated protein Cas6/Cse3/CasE [Streptomyces bohaiensis]NJQ13500.1 type I-E CRISPR-associated protein Cas6/Cse3/CasE [Streptomyces bohaiensis]